MTGRSKFLDKILDIEYFILYVEIRSANPMLNYFQMVFLLNNNKKSTDLSHCPVVSVK